MRRRLLRALERYLWAFRDLEATDPHTRLVRELRDYALELEARVARLELAAADVVATQEDLPLGRGRLRLVLTEAVEAERVRRAA